jgi:hypothetical protein
MSKINVLVIPSDRTGVGKFRSVDPHVHLQNLYPDEFHIDIDYNHDVKNGSNITLEQYQNATSHSRLKQFYIDVETANL